MDTRALVVLALVPLLAGCTTTDPAQETDAVDAWLESAPEDDPASTAPRGNAGWHVHDYWGGETEMTLYEGIVPVTVLHNHLLDEPPREQHLHGCDGELVSDSQGGSTEWALPDGEIVPPGTERLNVTFSWDDPTVTGVRFRFRPTAEPHDHDHGEHDHSTGYTDMGVAHNGEPVTIEVTPEMTDLGHDLLSHWRFILCADSDDSTSDLAQGTIDTSVVAYRADELALDPPHPDHWSNATVLPLGDYSWSGQAQAALSKGDGSWHQLFFDEGAIVPVLTDRVEVGLSVNASLDSPTGTSFLLYWKDSSTTDWNYRVVAPDSAEAGRIHFTIPIDAAGMVDSQYAQTSNWDVWLRLVADETVPAPAGYGTWSAPLVFEGDLSVVMHAVKFEG